MKGGRSTSLVAVFVWLLNFLSMTLFGVIPSATALASVPGPVSWQPQAVWVAEFSATYAWHAGSSVTADGYRVIGASGGAPGRWICASGRLYISTLDPSGATDDWPRFIAALNAMAYRGEVWAVGALYCKSVVPLLSGVRLRCMPGAVFVVQLTPTGGPGGYTQSAFYAAPTYLGSAMSVSPAPALGATTMTVSAVDPSCVPGAKLILSGSTANLAQSFTVVSVSGTTINVLESVEHLFVGTVVVQTLVPPQDIYLDLTGSTITGTCDRYVELAAAWNCTVRGLRGTRARGVPTAMIGSFDIGGVGNMWIGCHADGGGTCNAGFAAESNTCPWIICCSLSWVGTSPSSAPVFLPSSVGPILDDLTFDHCWSGIAAAPSGAGDTVGSSRLSVGKVQITDQLGGYGITCADSDGIQITSLILARSAGYGLYLGPSIAAGPTNVQIDELIMEGASGTAGLYVADAQVQIGRLSVSGCTWPVQASSNGLQTTWCRIGQLFSNNCTGGLLACQRAEVEIGQGQWAFAFAGAVSGNSLGEGTYPYAVKIRSGTVYIAGTGVKTLADAQGLGTWELANFEVTKDGTVTASFGLYLGHTNGQNHVTLGPGVDLSAYATPLTTSSGDFVSVYQGRGVTGVSTTGGSSTLTWLQGTESNAIEASGALTSNATINVPAVPGLRWTLDNITSGAFTVSLAAGSGSVPIAQGKSADVRVNGSGNAVRVTPDT